MDFTKLAEYGITGVAIGLIAALVYLMTRVFNYLQVREKEHTACYDKLEKTIERNTKESAKSRQVSEQTFRYLKLRNGSLEKILNEKK